MRKIAMYPIYPAATCTVHLPVGAQIINVSLNVHQYYLHALVEQGQFQMEPRQIAAYLDEEINVPDGDIGAYIGMCRHSGMHRRWHFFDQGMVKGGAV